MKKMMMTLAAVLSCATLFTACDKNNGGLTPDVEDNTPVAVMMDYSLTVGDDMLSTMDLTIEYYDANGAVKTEQMTQKSWTKSIKAQLPATVGARLKARLKDGVDVSDRDKFTAAYGYNYNGFAVTAKDGVVGDIVNHGTSSSLDMKGDKVADWLERHADGLVKFAFDFDKDGKSSGRSWE